MEKHHKNLLGEIATIHPSHELYTAILFRIETERKHAARIRLAFFGMTTSISLIALFPALQYVSKGFYYSGFYEYFRLIFSEGTALLPYWKEFIFTMIETLPAFEIALSLGVLYALLESLKLAIKNMPPAFYPLKSY